MFIKKFQGVHTKLPGAYLPHCLSSCRPTPHSQSQCSFAHKFMAVCMLCSLKVSLHGARSYMFSVQNPGKMFSEHVLGTQAFILRALWNVLGTASFRFVTGTIRGLRSMTYCVYTAQRVRSFWCALSVLIAVCVLSPAHLVHCSRYRSVHICSGGVLTGSFCSENMVWPCSSWNCSSGNNSL